MKSLMHIRFRIILMFGIVFLPARYALAQGYAFVDLETVAGLTYSRANAINDSGDVVGELRTATNEQRWFHWHGGVMSLPSLPVNSTTAYAVGINERGTVCGLTSTTNGLRAFRYDGNSYTLLDPIGSAGISGSYGLNDSDVVAGWSPSSSTNADRHAATWQGASASDLGTLGSGRDSYAYAINNKGWVAGYSHSSTVFNERAFVYKEGGMINLGLLSGHTLSQAYAINDTGWVVGMSANFESGADGSRAFIWTPHSGMSGLPRLPAGKSSAAYGINDSGLVVGFSSVSLTTNPHAVLWRNGVLIDLNSVTGLPPGCILTTASAINNRGQIVGLAKTGSRNFAFLLNPVALSVTAPAADELLLANSPYNIQWLAGVDSVKIEFSLDDGVTYQQVAGSIPGVQGEYTWMVPDTLSTKCRIRLTDAADPSATATSERFRTKGYVMTRLDDNGDYEAFTPQLHGWSFGNNGAAMWPPSWWAQFNYATGNDPNTGRAYFFPLTVEDVQPSNFIDWPLFVQAFRPENCYKADNWISTKALDNWSMWKDSTFEGACTGFANSALLAFDRPEALQDSFPALGNFNHLHDVVLNNETRKVVNQLSFYQLDAGHINSDVQRQGKTPRETLAEIKAMLFPGTNDNRALTISLQSPSISHAINVFGLKVENRDLGIYHLSVYDNILPGTTITAIMIDSSANTWSGIGEGPYSGGLFLSDPASTYLPHPRFQGTTPAAEQLTGNIRIGNTPNAAMLITDQNGNSIGFSDSIITNTLPNALAIVPRTGAYHPPIGYYISGGEYSIRLNEFSNPKIYLGVFGDTVSYKYTRGNGLASQADNLRLGSGLSTKNDDPIAKQINLRTIVSLDTLEMTFDLANLVVATGDSLLVHGKSEGDLLAENHGNGKSYDLNLYLGSPTRVGAFAHPSISLGANSSHRIVPSWNNLLSSPVKIFVDLGMDGTVDDTLLMDNTVHVKEEGTMGHPASFALFRNYPNPFNPGTSIGYRIKGLGYVTLKVYDVLGREIATLVNEVQAPGEYSVAFDGSHLSSGVYFYQLMAGSFVETRKMLLAK